MPINVNGTSMSRVNVNNTDIRAVDVNGTLVFLRPDSIFASTNGWDSGTSGSNYSWVGTPGEAFGVHATKRNLIFEFTLPSNIKLYKYGISFYLNDVPNYALRALLYVPTSTTSGWGTISQIDQVQTAGTWTWAEKNSLNLSYSKYRLCLLQLNPSGNVLSDWSGSFSLYINDCIMYVF